MIKKKKLLLTTKVGVVACLVATLWHSSALTAKAKTQKKKTIAAPVAEIDTWGSPDQSAETGLPWVDESQSGFENFRMSEDLRKNSVGWRAPDFSKQDGALGWNPKVFTEYPAFAAQVKFWIDIYTKYDSNQGVIHFTEDLSQILKPVDLTGFVGSKKEKEKFLKREVAETIAQVKSMSEFKLKSIELTPLQIRALALISNDSYETIQEDPRLREVISRNLKQMANPRRIRFQQGQRDRFNYGIFLSGSYLKPIEEFLRKEKLPIELARLPFVESSFNLAAKSKVGASGVWQIMRNTGQELLTVNSYIDERNHPLRAAKAAAVILKNNYSLLGSWELALTAYNHGHNGLLKVVRRVGVRDLASLASRYHNRSFGFASKNFYPCFLAALEVESHASRYFANPVWAQPEKTVEAELLRPLMFTDFLGFFDRSPERLIGFNPQFTAAAIKTKPRLPKGLVVTLPEKVYAPFKAFNEYREPASVKKKKKYKK